MFVLNVPWSVDATFAVWSELTLLLVRTSELTPPVIKPLECTTLLVRIDSKIEQTKINTMLVLKVLCTIVAPFEMKYDQSWLQLKYD